MNPTMNLRFIERDVLVPRTEHVSVVQSIKVLQQQFENIDTKTGEIHTEWKDVPLSKEQ